jgi:membrane-bound lytic murein transglycosylase F
MPRHEDLFRALRRGDVDLVGEPTASDRSSSGDIRSSLPLRHADVWLVGHLAAGGGRLGLQYASDAWHHALVGRSALQGFTLDVVGGDLSQADILKRVARGSLDASLVYDFDLDGASEGAHGLKPLRRIRQDVPLSWGLRAADRVLISRVNRFLQEQRLTRDLIFTDRGDWPAIQARGRIRLVTLYRPETYFAWSGELLGYEYELARGFASDHGLELDVLLAADRGEMLERLNRGEADFAAALLSDRDLVPGVVATRPYLSAGALLVSLGADEATPQLPDSLEGLRLAVAAGSPFDTWIRAESGQAELAVVDAMQFRLERHWRSGLQSLKASTMALERHWMVRDDSPMLRRKIDDHWSRDRNGLRHNLLTAKYFGDSPPIRVQQASRAFYVQQVLSPYDELVRRYAGYYGFDWRLILAMVFQESRFDPRAVSRSGARGLMQVKDAAAQQVGIGELFEPRNGIHAGVRYLDWVRNQFEPELDIRDRLWFSLAAYNGGLTHVRAARRLADSMGLDSRRWFGHVEVALKALGTPQGDPDGRYLAMDEEQIVNYVRRIRDRFAAYVRLTEKPSPRTASRLARSESVLRRPSTPPPAVQASVVSRVGQE